MITKRSNLYFLILLFLLMPEGYAQQANSMISPKYFYDSINILGKGNKTDSIQHVYIGNEKQINVLSEKQSSEAFGPFGLTMITIIGTLIVGILTGIYTDSLKKEVLSPKLKLTFKGREDLIQNANTSDGHKNMYLYDTPDRVVVNNTTIEFRSVYIRILVSNLSKRFAHSCRPYLTKIQKETSSGFVIIFNDLLPLQWSYMLNKDFDIPGRTSLFFALAAIDDYNKILKPITEGQPFVYKELLQPPGTFIFSIVLTADFIHPIKKEIVVVLENNDNVFFIKDTYML